MQRKKSHPNWMGFFLFLKQLQLLVWSIRTLRNCSIEKLDVRKLLVSDAHHSHFSMLRYETSDTPHMYLRILHAGTMAHIDGKLKHCKPILLQGLTKISIRFLVLFRFRRKIKENKYPHNSVFTQPVEVCHFIYISGYATCRNSPAKHL